MSDKPLGTGWRSRSGHNPKRSTLLDLSGMTDDRGTFRYKEDCPKCFGGGHIPEEGTSYAISCFCCYPDGFDDLVETLACDMFAAVDAAEVAAILERRGVRLRAELDTRNQERRDQRAEDIRIRREEDTWAREEARRAERVEILRRVQVEHPERYAEYGEARERLRQLVALLPDARPRNEPGETQTRLAELEREMGLDTTGEGL